MNKEKSQEYVFIISIEDLQYEAVERIGREGKENQKLKIKN
jgi:hypothetical protein